MNPKQKIYLILAIFTAAIIILLYFVINPLIAMVKGDSHDLGAKNNLLAAYQEKGSDYLTALQNKYTGLEPEITKINSSFANRERIIDFILAVEEVAALTGNYQEIREAPRTEEKNVLSFQVLLWGSFPNLIKFLARIENMGYFIDTYSLEINRIGEGELKNLADKEIMVSVGDIKSVISIKAYTK